MRDIALKNTISMCFEPTCLSHAIAGKKPGHLTGEWKFVRPLLLCIESETGDPADTIEIPVEDLIPYLDPNRAPWGENDDHHLAAARATADILDELATAVREAADAYAAQAIRSRS